MARAVRLLVVDLRDRLREVVRAIAQSGVSVERCTSSIDALTRAASGYFDAVLSTLKASPVSGAQLCHALRTTPETSHLLVALGIEDRDPCAKLVARCAGATLTLDLVDPEGATEELLRALATLRLDRGVAEPIPAMLDVWSQNLDWALVRAELGAAIRELSAAEGTREFFEDLIRVAQSALGYRALGLYIEQAPTELFLHVPVKLQAPVESTLRQRLALALDVPTEVVEDDRTGLGPPLDYVRVPLEHGRARLGELVFGVGPQFGPDEGRIAALIGSELCLPLRAALQMATTRRLDTSDGLTSLLVRRAFIDACEREAERAGRYGHPTALVLLDVDHLGAINEMHGRGAGDEILREASRVLRRLARGSDVVGRWAGDQFAVLLPETGEAGARVVAERIRGALGQARTRAASADLGITVSVGVSAAGGTFRMDRLTTVAEEALLASKARGRNRVTLRTIPDESAALGPATADSSPPTIRDSQSLVPAQPRK